MRTKLLLTLITALFTVSASAEMRTWRDQESAKAINAELVAIKGDNIRLKMENGRFYTLPIARFHKDDQAYIKTWKEDMKDAAEDGEATSVAASDIRRSIRITPTEEKGESKREKIGDKGKKTTTSMKYDIRIDVARSAPTLKNVVVNYTIFKRTRSTNTKDKSSGDYRIVRVNGTQKFDTLKPGVPRNFKSDPVTTVDSREEIKEKKKKYEKRLSEEVMGIHAEVIVNGAKAIEVEEPSGLLRNVEKYN